jgi:hypothetical protein
LDAELALAEKNGEVGKLLSDVMLSSGISRDGMLRDGMLSDRIDGDGMLSDGFDGDGINGDNDGRLGEKENEGTETVVDADEVSRLNDIGEEDEASDIGVVAELWTVLRSVTDSRMVVVVDVLIWPELASGPLMATEVGGEAVDEPDDDAIEELTRGVDAEEELERSDVAGVGVVIWTVPGFVPDGAIVIVIGAVSVPVPVNGFVMVTNGRVTLVVRKFVSKADVVDKDRRLGVDVDPSGDGRADEDERKTDTEDEVRSKDGDDTISVA